MILHTNSWSLQLGWNRRHALPKGFHTAEPSRQLSSKKGNVINYQHPVVQAMGCLWLHEIVIHNLRELSIARESFKIKKIAVRALLILCTITALQSTYIVREKKLLQRFNVSVA